MSGNCRYSAFGLSPAFPHFDNKVRFHFSSVYTVVSLPLHSLTFNPAVLRMGFLI